MIQIISSAFNHRTTLITVVDFFDDITLVSGVEDRLNTLEARFGIREIEAIVLLVFRDSNYQQ